MLGLRGRTPGLAHHTITFPADYDAEFDDVFRARRLVRDPTIYVSASCATDDSQAPADGENWFVLVNAPAGRARDARRTRTSSGSCPRSAWASGSSSGARRTPADLERETGAVGGAIYGAAPHGRLGTLRRPGPVVGGVRGLYRVGGTAHPGGGLPLVALSGRVVAELIGPAREPHPRAAADRAVPLLIVLGVLVRRARRRRPATDAAPRRASRGGRAPRSSPPAPARVDVGRGVARRAIFRPVRARARPAPSSSSCTAGGPSTRRCYGLWIAHLVGRGDTVIYPAYQEAPFSDPSRPLREHVRGAAGRVRGCRRRAGPARRRRALRGRRARGRLRGARRAPPGCRVPAVVFARLPRALAARRIPVRLAIVDARRHPGRDARARARRAPTTGVVGDRVRAADRAHGDAGAGDPADRARPGGRRPRRAAPRRAPPSGGRSGRRWTRSSRLPPRAVSAAGRRRPSVPAEPYGLKRREELLGVPVLRARAADDVACAPRERTRTPGRRRASATARTSPGARSATRRRRREASRPGLRAERGRGRLDRAVEAQQPCAGGSSRG